MVMKIFLHVASNYFAHLHRAHPLLHPADVEKEPRPRGLGLNVLLIVIITAALPSHCGHLAREVAGDVVHGPGPQARLHRVARDLRREDQPQRVHHLVLRTLPHLRSQSVSHGIYQLNISS